jgi:hypothetical protein
VDALTRPVMGFGTYRATLPIGIFAAFDVIA